MNVFVLYGQTATGKTTNALELARLHNGEIVNFDSRQIYKKLDIVTGKDKPTETNVPIWLYDVVDPKDTFSSAEYVELAIPLLQDIIARGKTPILVGGTGYYMRHLLYGVPEIKAQVDWELRRSLEQLSVAQLQARLKKMNAQMFEDMNKSDQSNPRRLIRRIEIASSGAILPESRSEITLISRLANLRGLQRPMQGVKLQFVPFFHQTTEIAREKIALRVRQRIENGAIEEVKGLLDQGYTKTDPGLNAIGYQQIIEHLSGEISLQEAINLWTTKEVQYAKRQKTYFRKLFSSPSPVA